METPFGEGDTASKHEGPLSRGWVLLRPLIPTLVACAVLFFMCAGVGGAFIISAAAPFIAVWALYSCYIIWRKPEKFRIQLVKVGLLAGTLSVIGAFHYHYYTSARAAGDYALHLVNAYRDLHGTYPNTLEEAGWKLGKYGGQWRIVYQGHGATDDPMLMYPATWIIFDMYDYNFKTRQWEYLPD